MTTMSLSRERGRERRRSSSPHSDHSPSSGSSGRLRDSRSRLRSDSRSQRHPRDDPRSDSPSPSRSRSRNIERIDRDRNRLKSEGLVPPKTTKVVVERLSKNVNKDHLYEIFGTYGPIRDLDLPINRQLGTNRGTAYILFASEADAEVAICNMHEAKIDGSVINVSIVLPRSKLSPTPPSSSRAANYARRPAAGRRRGSFGHQGHRFPPGPSNSHGRRRDITPSGRFNDRFNTYRPRSVSRSVSRSPSGPSPHRGDAHITSRYRSRSKSYNSISRSRSPVPRKRDGGR